MQVPSQDFVMGTGAVSREGALLSVIGLEQSPGNEGIFLTLACQISNNFQHNVKICV